VALVGTLNGARETHASHPRHRAPQWVMFTGAALSAIVAVTSALYLGPHSVDAEENAYRNAWKGRDQAPFEKEALKSVSERHPASWYIPFAAGLRHYYLGDGNPLPWLARAIELNASSAAAHYYIGATLLSAGYLDQAMMELRLGARFHQRLAAPAAELLADKTHSFETLSKIAVTRDDKLLLWTALARALDARGYPDEAEAADRAVLDIDSEQPDALARHIRRLARRGDTDQALALADRLSKVPDYGPTGATLAAEVLGTRDEHEKAVQTLEQALAEYDRDPRLLRALAWSRQRAGDLRGALDAAGALKAMATNMKSRAAAIELEARLSLADGRVQEALARYREAYLSDRSNEAVLRSLADLAERHGDEKRAVEALRDLLRLHPGDEEIERRLSRIEKQGRIRQWETGGKKR
jgi:Tfp pilus assembly protein PilF